MQDPRLDKAVYQHIAYVALFGDVRFNNGGLPNCLANAAANLVGIHLGWVRGNAWCLHTSGTNAFVAHGAFGMRDPYIPSELTDRVGSWCNFSDAACTSDIFGFLLLGISTSRSRCSTARRWMAWYPLH